MTAAANDQSDREQGLGRLLVSCLEAMDAGQAVDRQALLAHYPQFAEELARFLDDQDRLERRVSPLRAAARAQPLHALRAEPAGPVELGDYRLLREIGRGGMGVVYEAEQVSLGRRVALKVLPLAGMLDVRQLQRFQNEARAAACLHHTHIVPVYAVGREHGISFYAMQLIEGQSLAAALAELRRQAAGKDAAGAADPEATTAYPPPPAAPAAGSTAPQGALSTGGGVGNREYVRRVAQLGAQAAEALDYAHQLGIVHRDVKPANLLLDGRGQLWVTDFGLALFRREGAESLTLTGDLVGTLRYMSPEQALAKRVPIDHRTDVYSLGATLYELLTLRPVFEGQDRQELLRQISFDEPRPLRRLNPALPAELETVVLKALAKEPAERYATAQELADDLQRFLQDEPIRARRATLLQRSRKWARRHRPLVWSVAAAVSVTVLVLAGSLGWLARDWAARHAATEQVVAEALQESMSWQQQRRLPEALSAARRAAGLVTSGTAEEALRRRVGARVADLEFVTELERVRLDVAASVTDQGDWGHELGDALYTKLFRAFGINIEALPAEEAAERIRSSTVAVEVAGVLDSWADQRCAALRLRPGANKNWKQILKVARLADPDDWRNRLRKAWEEDDLKAMKALAVSAPVGKLPPATLVLLVRGAGARLGEPAVALMVKARQQYPDDFWINYQLGEALIKSQPPRYREASRYFTVASALQPRNALILLFLGAALKRDGQLDEAIATFREAIRLNKDFAHAHNNLGAALHQKGKADEAIAAFQEALRLQKDMPLAHYNLGVVLSDKGRLDEAIAEYEEAIRLKKDDPEAHNNLAVALKTKGRLDDAIAECHKAFAIDPRHAPAHNTLGTALQAKGRLDDAIAEYRKAIAFKMGDFRVHANLALALKTYGKLDEAITAYQDAIRLKKDDYGYYNNIGILLQKRGRLADAIEAFRNAIRLKKDHPAAYSNLGAALAQQGKPGDAITALREAIRWGNDLPDPHYNLGYILSEQNRLDEAITEYREVIRLKKGYCPEAHYHLGLILRHKGQFAEALVYVRRGHELGSKTPGWSYPSARWVREGERLVDLDGKLPAILRGEEEPATAAERITYAELCAYKRLYTSAAGFYRDAFTAQPALENGPGGHRYSAACAAALAGCGQGKEAGGFGGPEAARLRQQALKWLRSELKLSRHVIQKSGDKAGPAIAKQMQHWLQDTDLAGVRGEEALAKLSPAERKDWQTLWQEVEALRQRAAPQPQAAGSGQP
jgi:serine/threonine protein kinase/Flp pilus assembly protein TadD